jgi:hypothetical protein
MKKLSLEMDALAVDSFQTTPAAAPGVGTVRAQSEDDPPSGTTPPLYYVPCTCDASCLCPTAAYFCATAPDTAVSCDYTVNESCQYTAIRC